MAIFSTTSDDKPRAPQEAPRRRTDPTTLSIIAKDLAITGDLVTDGTVKIEGRVTGAVRADSQVLVAPGARVEGDLHTTEAVIGGEVKGTVHASDRVEIQATAVVNGDIMAKRIVVMEGGRVNGEVKMTDGSSSGSGAKSDAVPGRTVYPKA